MNIDLASSGPTRNRPSTRVQFPRFEAETNPDQSITKRHLVRHAQPQQWLGDTAIRLQIVAEHNARSKGAENYSQMAETGWWGLYHNVRKTDSRIRTMTTLLTGRVSQLNVWMTSYSHDYCWDAQAVPGSRLELVLQSLNTRELPNGDCESGVQEHAALLINRHKSDDQLLVVAGDEGWRAPLPEESDRAASALFAMSRIALDQVS